MFIAALSSELSEKMAIGGKLTLMGILIVFGLLALIVVILTIMERIMRKSGEKPKKERKNLKELFKNKMQKNEPKPETTVTPGAKTETRSRCGDHCGNLCLYGRRMRGFKPEIYRQKYQKVKLSEVII